VVSRQGDWIRLGKKTVQYNPDKFHYNLSNWIIADATRDPGSSWGWWHGGNGINAFFYDGHVNWIKARVPQNTTVMLDQLYRTKLYGLE
jgi:prepilin-type processing-associated H-X9-DG protein